MDSTPEVRLLALPTLSPRSLAPMLVVLKAKPVVLLRTRPAAEPSLLLSKVFAWYLVEVVLVAESLAAVAAVAEVEFAEAPDACVSQRLVVP